MSQGNYTVLFYTTLILAVWMSGSNIVAAVGLLICSAIYLVGGDICKKLEKLNESSQKNDSISSQPTVS